MADNKTPIRYINGHPVADQEARARIGELYEEIENIKESGAGGSGGIQTMEVIITIDWDTETMTCDKTVDEIIAAKQVGILPIAKSYEISDGEKILTDVYTSCSDVWDEVEVDGEWVEYASVLFSRTVYDGHDRYDIGLFIRHDGTIEMATDDNFKTSRLVVQNGFILSTNNGEKFYRVTVNDSGQLTATLIR